jgi:hypothetical protein
MADLNVAETDSGNAATIPNQGTEASTNDLSATNTAPEPQTAPQGFDDDFVKRLESLDPTTLPQSFQEKFVPKSEFTKKTQALAEDRKRLDMERQSMFETVRKVIEQRQAPSGPTPEEVKLKELSELAAAGDSTAQMQMADILAERKIAPIRTQITLQNAAQAARTNPLAGDAVQEHWNEIVQTLQNDPVIAALATANNYAAADRVMVALGLEHKVRNLMPKVEAAMKENEALKAKLATYEKERVAGLPSSTTRAGTTAGRPVAAEPKTLEEVDLRAAWVEAGGDPNAFR